MHGCAPSGKNNFVNRDAGLSLQSGFLKLEQKVGVLCLVGGGNIKQQKENIRELSCFLDFREKD